METENILFKTNSSDFKRFYSIHEKTHITYITHIIHITYITHIIYITNIFCITHIAHITCITYITNIFKFIFKYIKIKKKTIKIFFYNFFLYIKMVNNYYQKHKEKPRKLACEGYQNFPE